MTKLIDAEAAKAAILELTSRADDLPLLDVTPEIGHLKAAVVKVTVTKILATLDALPDASEGRQSECAKHVCDERCMGENGHHAWPQQAGDGAEE